MLDRFRAAQAGSIALLRRQAEEGQLPTPWNFSEINARPGFAAALRTAGAPAVIAEYKRASPSRGVINLDLTPADAARMYADGGAACFSVLTERAHFQGDLRFLAEMAFADRPMLRKDFLLDPLQVVETAATPASALLLIMRMFKGSGPVREMLDACRQYELEAVCEVFDEADLDLAREAGAEIIQVNNRDLDRLTTDLGTSRRLAPRKQAGELWISASGLDAPEQLEEMADLGFDAVLIGTSLMSQTNPGEALRRLSAVAKTRNAR
ncbi:MAG: indole-3-glycerol-phosphate synthase [Proteobacteria bacterium]|nr:indole-3-glycerol-phosphate synthase [Pseudomonadota bacterium]